MSVLIKDKRRLIPGNGSGLYEYPSATVPEVEYQAGPWSTGSELRIPCVNVIENTTGYVIDLACPGCDKSDFKVSVEHGILTIWSEKESAPLKAETETFRRKEYSFTTWSRSFEVPENVLTEKIAATYSNGVLTIMLPKNEISSTKPVKEISVR